MGRKFPVETEMNLKNMAEMSVKKEQTGSVCLSLRPDNKPFETQVVSRDEAC